MPRVCDGHAKLARDSTCYLWGDHSNKMEYHQLEAKNKVRRTWTIRIEMLKEG
jgi:hypothetical protein